MLLGKLYQKNQNSLKMGKIMALIWQVSLLHNVNNNKYYKIFRKLIILKIIEINNACTTTMHPGYIKVANSNNCMLANWKINTNFYKTKNGVQE